jgi:hypothetical protein
MVYMYRRCNPQDCCKEQDYGAPGAAADKKGRQITKASSATCAKSTAKGTGAKCECRYVLHYREYIRDGNPIQKKNDTGWQVLEEKLHDSTDWSDADEAKRKKDEAALGKDKDIQLLLLCIELDADGDPVEIPKPK